MTRVACEHGVKLVWSDEDVKYLREHFAHTPNSDIGTYLGISPMTVKKKADELGLRKNKGFRSCDFSYRYVRKGVIKVC
jgi:hypothetical protein